MINDDRKTSYRLLYCEIIDIMKGLMANRISEILKKDPLLDSVNFKNYCENFPSIEDGCVLCCCAV
jgi:hypothetical protein